MFVLAIFILSCSAGLSTEYRLPGTLTSKLQDQQRLWSDRWKYLMELVKKIPSDKSWGVSLLGRFRCGGKLWIFICKYFWAWHKTFPSLPLLFFLCQPLKLIFSIIFSFTQENSARASPPPQLICLLCRFQFQFYRRRNFSYL